MIHKRKLEVKGVNFFRKKWMTTTNGLLLHGGFGGTERVINVRQLQ